MSPAVCRLLLTGSSHCCRRFSARSAVWDLPHSSPPCGSCWYSSSRCTRNSCRRRSGSSHSSRTGRTTRPDRCLIQEREPSRPREGTWTWECSVERKRCFEETEQRGPAGRGETVASASHSRKKRFSAGIQRQFFAWSAKSFLARFSSATLRRAPAADGWGSGRRHRRGRRRRSSRAESPPERGRGAQRNSADPRRHRAPVPRGDCRAVPIGNRSQPCGPPGTPRRVLGCRGESDSQRRHSRSTTRGRREGQECGRGRCPLPGARRQEGDRRHNTQRRHRRHPGTGLWWRPAPRP